MFGAKLYTEAADCICGSTYVVVGELTVVGGSMIERTCGRNSSENAGISSASEVRIFTVENLRFPGEGSSSQGKSGPKARLKKRSRWTTG